MPASSMYGEDWLRGVDHFEIISASGKRNMSDLEAAQRWLWWINWGTTIATLLVALGVVGEFAGMLLAPRFQRTIDEAHNREIAHANAQAAEANARAARANLELDRFKAPRKLTSDQIERLVSKLRPFAGTAFQLLKSSEGTDVPELGSQILDILHEARWFLLQIGTIRTRSAVVGILINCDSGDEAASSLTDGLRSEGLQVQGPSAPISGLLDWDSFTREGGWDGAGDAPVTTVILGEKQ